MRLRTIVTKYFGIASLAVLATASSLLMLSSSQANAATATVNPGDSIQDAIDAANSGDTVSVNAGTYNETLSITKPLTLQGVGVVVIKTQSASVNKGVDIQNTQNVTLKNLTFDGEHGTTTGQTGIDINSVDTIALDTVTVKNYAKNGISVVAQQDPSFVKGGNLSLTNVTSSGNGFSGLAFYTKSSDNNEVELTGLTFAGITTLSDNTQAGIRFGDAGDTAKTTGSDGAPVALGTVHFSNNQSTVTNETGNSSITVSSTSTIDGRPVTAADFPGSNVTIATPDAPVVPGVPNTAVARH